MVALDSIYTCPKSARPGSKTPPLVIPTSKTVHFLCPKCGSVKKSRERSCCARGGAWFKACGDVGDSQFDHTWADGIQACKRELLKDQALRCSLREWHDGPDYSAT